MKLRSIRDIPTHIKLLYKYFIKKNARALVLFARMPNSKAFVSNFGVGKSKFRKDYRKLYDPFSASRVDYIRDIGSRKKYGEK